MFFFGIYFPYKINRLGFDPQWWGLSKQTAENEFDRNTGNKENQKWVDQRKLLSQSEDSKEFPKEIVNAAMADISQQIFHKRHNHILLTCYKLFPQTSNSKVPNVITIQSAIHPSVSVMSTILRHKMVRYLRSSL